MPLIYKKNSSEHEAKALSYNTETKELSVVRIADGEQRTIWLDDIVSIDMNDNSLSELHKNKAAFLRDLPDFGLQPNDDNTKFINAALVEEEETLGESMGFEPEEDDAAESSEEVKKDSNYEKEIAIAAGVLVLLLFLD